MSGEFRNKMRGAGRELAKRGDFEEMKDALILDVILDAMNELYARWPKDRVEQNEIDETLELIDYLPNVMNSDGELADLDEDGTHIHADGSYLD